MTGTGRIPVGCYSANLRTASVLQFTGRGTFGPFVRSIQTICVLIADQLIGDAVPGFAWVASVFTRPACGSFLFRASQTLWPRLVGPIAAVVLSIAKPYVRDTLDGAV